jgi:hypothetical protein
MTHPEVISGPSREYASHLRDLLDNEGIIVSGHIENGRDTTHEGAKRRKARLHDISIDEEAAFSQILCPIDYSTYGSEVLQLGLNM